jgi:DNA-binding NtrC family response regulator
VVLAKPGSEIQSNHLPFMGDNGRAASEMLVSTSQPFDAEPYHTARGRVLADFERRYLTVVLNKASGNMSKAARLAGVDRTTLYRLMEKQGMQRETIMIDAGDA